MPFGIRSATEVMQKRNHQAFGDIEGVHVIADDLIIGASTPEEHDRILKKVLNRAREENVKFTIRKIQFRLPKVLYMGNIFTPEGMKPDPSKVQAIVDIPQPTDKPAPQRLLGMVLVPCIVHPKGNRHH